MKSSNEIAIIGVGGVFPDAHDAAAYWKNITSGHVAIRDVSDERWEASLFYSKDRQAPDKTYSKIGGFVGAPPFDRKTFKIAPKVVEQMDDVQKIALTSVHQALADAGLEASPGSGVGRAFDRQETAVILGNSMGGKREDKTNFRVFFPKAREAPTSTRQILLFNEQLIPLPYINCGECPITIPWALKSLFLLFQTSIVSFISVVTSSFIMGLPSCSLSIPYILFLSNII